METLLIMSVSLSSLASEASLFSLQMHDERDDDQEPILDISRRQSGALDCLLLGRTRGEEGMDTR